MSLEDLVPVVRQKLASAAGFRARVKFDCGEEGVIFVDTTQSPALISHDEIAAEAEADTTVLLSREILLALMEGRQDPNIAFLSGKVKIRGSTGIALKLYSFLGD